MVMPATSPIVCIQAQNVDDCWLAIVGLWIVGLWIDGRCRRWYCLLTLERRVIQIYEI